MDGDVAFVRLYVMTRETLVQPTREVTFTRIPCVGEWFRLRSSGIFPSEITEITHDENGSVEIVIGPQTDQDGILLFHENAEELRDDVEDLVKHGWNLVSEGPNRIWGTQTTKPKHRGVRTRPHDPDRV